MLWVLQLGRRQLSFLGHSPEISVRGSFQKWAQNTCPAAFITLRHMRRTTGPFQRRKCDRSEGWDSDCSQTFLLCPSSWPTQANLPVVLGDGFLSRLWSAPHHRSSCHFHYRSLGKFLQPGKPRLGRLSAAGASPPKRLLGRLVLNPQHEWTWMSANVII